MVDIIYITIYIYNIENQNLLRRRASKEIEDVEIILQLVSKFYQTQEKNKKWKKIETVL